MDRSEAQDHIAMVDRILSRAENRPFRPIGALLIVWGVAAGLMNFGQQVFASTGKPLYVFVGEIALLLATSASIVIAILTVRNAGCLSTSEKRLGRAIGAVWVCVVCAAASEPNVFAGWSAGGIWTLGAAITLLISAFSGDRISLGGGIVLLLSLLFANYATPHTPGYTLAAGMFLGYAVPGVIITLRGLQATE